MERKLFLLDELGRDVLASTSLSSPLRPSVPTLGADDHEHVALEALLEQQAEDGHVWSVEYAGFRRPMSLGPTERLFRLVETPEDIDGLTASELLAKADSGLSENSGFIDEGWLVGRDRTDDMIEARWHLVQRADADNSTLREINELVAELSSTIAALAGPNGERHNFDGLSDQVEEALCGSRYAYVDHEIVLASELPEAA